MEPDYHDFVFKNGKLVGKFEEMYQECSDPWFQGKYQDRPEIIHTLKMVEGRKFERILELGCGHGHLANKLSKLGPVLGIDVSPTAIKKAQELYPNLEFDVCDMIKGIETRNNLNNKNELELFELIILSGTLWYVLEYVDKIFDNISKHLTHNGEFILNLPYPLEDDFYGKDILPDLQSVINYVKKYFDVIEGIDIDEEYKKGAPIIIIHAKKRMR